MTPFSTVCSFVYQSTATFTIRFLHFFVVVFVLCPQLNHIQHYTNYTALDVLHKINKFSTHKKDTSRTIKLWRIFNFNYKTFHLYMYINAAFEGSASGKGNKASNIWLRRCMQQIVQNRNAIFQNCGQLRTKILKVTKLQEFKQSFRYYL